MPVLVDSRVPYLRLSALALETLAHLTFCAVCVCVCVCVHVCVCACVSVCMCVCMCLGV